ncbi:hypothetical protein SD80_012820 [Scytonema tolypothrichoides VB-61278]|nr:hypothetical protein SD80_012820 [Scytonema tolypothrichoides VB-61278]
MFYPKPDSERVLYRHERALDAVLDLGAKPRRFWKVLYPLYCVSIEAEQRPATDFEPIEELLETGIAHAHLRSVEELANFFALDHRLVSNLINRLKAIGHIDLNHEPLTITELGLSSLKDRRSYSRLQTRHVLYFDVLRRQPLQRAHYRLRFYTMDEADEMDEINEANGRESFARILHHYRTWDDQALWRLKEYRDYHAYNLPDEIEIETLKLARAVNAQTDIVYLPTYIVERLPDSKLNLPRLLAFSMIQGDHDPTLETGVNSTDPALAVIFREDEQVDLAAAVAEEMRLRRHQPGEWTFKLQSPRGAELSLTAPRELPTVSERELDTRRPLSLLNIGRYLYIRVRADRYCVWVTCPTPEIRRKAIVERAVEWLNQSQSDRTKQQIDDWLERRSRELEVARPTSDELVAVATRRGRWRVAEMLEVFNE